MKKDMLLLYGFDGRLHDVGMRLRLLLVNQDLKDWRKAEPQLV